MYRKNETSRLYVDDPIVFLRPVIKSDLSRLFLPQYNQE